MIAIPRVPKALRVVDRWMVPIMYILGGLRHDALQETHPWHTYRGFTPDDLTPALSADQDGNDSGTHKRWLFFFHAPIFGGWTQYVYLTPLTAGRPFYVGWTVHDDRGALIDYGINKLPISDPGIRMLIGPSQYRNRFFALDQYGEQIKLIINGHGELGDNKFPKARLF